MYKIPLLLGYALILKCKCTYFLLVEFFEGLALESKIDDDKPMIMKNSIHARKTLQRRAKTNKIKKARSNSKEYFSEFASNCLLCFLIDKQVIYVYDLIMRFFLTCRIL